MRTGNINKRVGTATLTDIYDAYFRGDFEACVALCDRYDAVERSGDIEVALLRARALIPLDRAEWALDVLSRVRVGDRSKDEYLVWQMLTGVAYVSLGQIARGLDVLKAVYHAMNGAHATIRADVAVNLGIALYRNNEFDEAASVLEAVPASADILYARALLYKAWIAWRQEELRAAADWFKDTLTCIDGCARYDRYVEAYALYGYSLLCKQLLRLPEWRRLRRRIESFNWSFSGLSQPRFWVADVASHVSELLGDREASRRWAMQAEAWAVSPVQRIFSACRLAALLGRYGESRAQRYFAEKGWTEYEGLDTQTRQREHALALSLAEELVHAGRTDEAQSLLRYYQDVIAPSIVGSPDAAKLAAHFAMIEGTLRETRGDRGAAENRYLSAFEWFRDADHTHCASVAAYHLATLTGDAQYRQYVAQTLRDASPGYWVKERLEHRTFEVRLTPAQLDVLKLVTDGLTNKEIAAARGISFFRARNVVADLLNVFGAANRAELSRIAIERGLVSSEKTSPRRVGQRVG